MPQIEQFLKETKAWTVTIDRAWRELDRAPGSAEHSTGTRVGLLGNLYRISVLKYVRGVQCSEGNDTN